MDVLLMMKDTVYNFFEVKHFMDRCLKYKQKMKALMAL
jgi:hypothetical protein